MNIYTLIRKYNMDIPVNSREYVCELVKRTQILDSSWFTVTQDHIDAAEPYNPLKTPLGLALNDITGLSICAYYELSSEIKNFWPSYKKYGSKKEQYNKLCNDARITCYMEVGTGHLWNTNGITELDVDWRFHTLRAYLEEFDKETHLLPFGKPFIPFDVYLFGNELLLGQKHDENYRSNVNYVQEMRDWCKRAQKAIGSPIIAFPDEGIVQSEGKKYKTNNVQKTVAQLKQGIEPNNSELIYENL